MGEFMFGVRDAEETKRLSKPSNLRKIRKIEKEYAVSWTAYEGPEKRLRSWFSGPNRGEPFDRQLAASVFAAMVEAGLDKNENDP